MMQAVNTDITIGGESILTRYGALVASESLQPPEPKTYTVDIPCGVNIDLTEALTGDVAYGDREQEFDLLFPEAGSRAALSEFVNAVHGRRLSYGLSDDPGYTYTGRFEVTKTACEHRGERPVMSATVKVTADPYKLKEHCAYRLNATGGRWFRFESGRRPVHPVISCEKACWVTVDGAEQLVPPGTYRLNGVVFREGVNELYINSAKLSFATWDDLSQDFESWDGMRHMTWDSLHLMHSGHADAPRSWDELRGASWADLAEKHWYELNFDQQNPGATSVTVTYDWEDL